MTDERGSNYDVGKQVKEAQAAAKAIGTTLLAHNAAIRHALFRCLRLVEDWKSDLYREKLTSYLRVPDYPQDHNRDDDVAAVLVVVQCVFADEDKHQHNWHANALRQAMAEGRTSENVVDYFKKALSPTDAAKLWPKTKKRLAKDHLEALGKQVNAHLAAHADAVWEGRQGLLDAEEASPEEFKRLLKSGELPFSQADARRLMAAKDPEEASSIAIDINYEQLVAAGTVEPVAETMPLTFDGPLYFARFGPDGDIWRIPVTTATLSQAMIGAFGLRPATDGDQNGSAGTAPHSQ
jgi:hypothetical protein